MDKKEPMRNFKMLAVVSLAVLAVVVASAAILIEKQDANGDSVSFDYGDLKYEITTANSYVTVKGLADGKSPESLTIPKTVVYEGREYVVKSIGERAFAGCRFGGTLTLEEEGIENIGGFAFFDCRFIESLTIPSSVKFIGESAFAGCGFGGKLTIEEGVESIGDGAFFNCSFTESLTIPPSVDSIGDYAFRGCSFSIVKILSGNFGQDVFRDCGCIAEIHIANGVTINEGSFPWTFTDCGKILSPGDIPGKWYKYTDGCMVKQGDF